MKGLVVQGRRPGPFVRKAWRLTVTRQEEWEVVEGEQQEDASPRREMSCRGEALAPGAQGARQGVGICERASPSTFFGKMCLGSS